MKISNPKTKAKQYLKLPKSLWGLFCIFSLLPLSDFILNIHASESVKNKSTLFHLCNNNPDMETKLETKYPILVSFKFFFLRSYFIFLEFVNIEISLAITKKICSMHFCPQELV